MLQLCPCSAAEMLYLFYMTDNKSSINRMKRRLYSRAARSKKGKRHELRERYYEVDEEWQDSSLPKPVSIRHKFHNKSKILLIAAAAFFIVSIAISTALFFGGSNFVSAKNIEIEVRGPTAIPGGDELSLQITIINRNTVPIKVADLLIEYPEGTRSAENINNELLRFRESLGTIGPGEQVKRTIKAVLFGEENASKGITVGVEYRIDDSNAIFFKDILYTLKISSAPLVVSIDALKEVVTGQDITLTIDVASNSSSVIRNVLLKAEYPFGFEFKNARPKPSFGVDVWELGDIPSEEKQRIVITGTLTGQDGEERVFQFSSGVQSDQDEQLLAAVFGTAESSVIIQRPFLSVELIINGETSPDTVIRSGKKVRADLIWVNNLSTRVFDGEIEIRFSGDILDKTSVSVSDGFYRSIDNTIVWNRDTDSSLAVLEPGEKGRLRFTFTPFGLASGRSFNNPQIDFNITVAGRRLREAQVPERIESTVEKTVKISSDLLISSRALFTIGPFVNTGAMPPKAEQETTYTIEWSLSNSSNRIEDVVVFATLPSYVRWTGQVSPSSEEVTFNPNNSIVTWRAGDIAPHIGFTSVPRKVAFQIALLPSISQIGSQPVIINEQTVEGFDQFALRELTSSKRALKTRLLSDPGVPQRHEIVVP